MESVSSHILVKLKHFVFIGVLQDLEQALESTRDPFFKNFKINRLQLYYKFTMESGSSHISKFCCKI